MGFYRIISRLAGVPVATSPVPVLVLLLVLCGSNLEATTAQAAGGLVVSPQLVELDSRNRSQVLTLANRGTETQTYRVSIVNYRMDAAGNLHPTDTPAEGEGFANALFRYAPRQITLELGKPQTVRILYRRPVGGMIGAQKQIRIEPIRIAHTSPFLRSGNHTQTSV